MKYYIMLISVLLVIANAQYSLSQEQEIEKLLEEETEYSDQSDLIELLSEFEKNPININTANEQQLSLIPWITPYLAQNIVSYRSQYGNFNNLGDLLNVPDITPDLYKVIKNYLTLEKKSTEKILELKHRSRVVRKIEKSIGYKKGNYFNSPNKYYNQIKMTYYQRYDIGLLFEKDSGEKNFHDLALCYFMYKDLAKKNRVIIGNYRLEVGQGMVFWNPYGSRKGSTPIYPAIKRERGLLGYRIVDENASLFGIASQICFKIYQLILFYSNTKLDASLNPLGTVNNFNKTGYHRTSSEINNKDILEEKLIGSRFVVFPAQNIRIGSTFYKSVYDKPIQNSDFERQRFYFRGKENYVLSTDYNIKYNNIYFFSEVAQSQNKGWGALFGTNFNIKPINIILLFRKYTKNFQSLHGSVFKEGGGIPQNEQGFYTGFRYKIFPKTKILFYYDIFKYHWRSYTENMPIAGTDFLFQIEQKINRKLILTLRLRNKQKEKRINIEDRFQRALKIFDNEKKLNLRFQLEYWPISNLKLRARIETSSFELLHKSKGVLLYQDIKYKITNYFNIYYRLTFFDINSYDSRVYQFENDLPYVLTNQMLYRKGSRWYICILYNMLSTMRFSFKYAVTNYEDFKAIGSGNDRINNDSVHTVSLQLETNF